jgi:DNA-binding Xre family transcriptional regulator
MKSLVFDAGPVISLTMNNLLWLLEPLQIKFAGLFYVPEAVKRELVDEPLATKRFKFEALQVQQYISANVLKVLKNEETKEEALHLLNLANNCFEAKNHHMNVVHFGEMSTIAAAKLLKSNAVVIDERTTRELVERPEAVARLMSNKLHTRVGINRKNLSALKEELRGTRVIRSAELVTVAYEFGLLNRYVRSGQEKVVPRLKQVLLDSVLWGVKLDGCSITKEEIDRLLKLEKL